MKNRPAAHLSLLIGLISLTFGTVCGAAPANDAPNASPSFTMTGNTPELDAADERVRQAGAQLGVAKKQLKAAQQLLKAAEADLRAAKTEREALALKTQAQTLADEAGMTPSQAAPVSNAPKSIATKPTVDTKPVVTTAPVMKTETPVLPATPGDAAQLKPIHNVDFNAEPLQSDEQQPAPAAGGLQLR